MSLPGRPPRGRGPDQPDGHVVMSAGRGAVLVGLAVVAGLLILTTLDNGSPATSTPIVTEQPATTPTVPATNPDGTPATAAPGTTDTTKAKKNSGSTDTKGARANDQVVVQVLNGSGVQGAATQRSNDLKAKGYQVLPAGNAPAQRTGSAVQCKQGYEKEAQVMKQTLSEVGVTAEVEPVPNPLPSGFDAAANCYLLLGK